MSSYQHLHNRGTQEERPRGQIPLPNLPAATPPIGNSIRRQYRPAAHQPNKENKNIDEVHRAIQESVNSWGNLLIMTGGVLQQAKYFYSIISFDWNNGDWSYASNASKGELGITVPLPGGGNTLIDHKRVEHAEKILRAMTSPDGNSGSAIGMMQEKAQQWINAVRNGHLHRRNLWFSLKVQFWPRIGYGL
jgi:hypothetical protein